MNLRPLYALVLLSTLAELGGCKALLKKKDPDPAPSATVTAPPAVVAPLPTLSAVPTPEPAPVAAVDEATVPASQDFEDEAFTTVTAANFKAQFTTLKTAISK
ncbi:MAG: hypothetical protein ABI488_15320 [Polyangiaceae bacterium]